MKSEGFLEALTLQRLTRRIQSMRIIAGNAKGRKLKSPKSAKVIRPALSIVREAIFSALGDVTDKCFLDVFAGTGSLGLEALSRGALRADFVDGGDEAVGLIIENLKILGFSDRGHVFKRKLPFGIRSLKLVSPPDIIFCDPPYDRGLLVPTLKLLEKHIVVDPQTLIIVEHSPRESPRCAGLTIIKERRYGQTLISTLQRITD